MIKKRDKKKVNDKPAREELALDLAVFLPKKKERKTKKFLYKSELNRMATDLFMVQLLTTKKIKCFGHKSEDNLNNV